MASTTILPQNVHSLTDFLRHHKRHLQRLKRSRQPSVLTLNGKAEVVVQDAAAYQEMLEAMEAAQSKQGIAGGIASMERGEGESAGTIFTRLRKRHSFKSE